MAITTNCSGCGKTLAVADEFAGRQARCPACGQIYTVPAPISLAPITPATTEPTNLEATVGYENTAPLDLELPTPANNATDSNLPPTPTVSPTATPSNSPSTFQSTGSNSSGVQYWMKATNGAEYGPADTATLGRWFTEGRVGPDYQIRIGQYGHWQPASAFQSIVTNQLSMPETGVNPYAAHSTFTPGMATNRVYPKADQSGLVLAMGILSWIGGCPIFGIIAWVVGAQALADINLGQADPSSRGVVQFGYYIGMINVIIWIACGGFMLLGIVLSALS